LSIVGLDDEAVVDRIINDRIDILVDLAGHTADNRLKVFAHKPAPVQVTWLGYPNTTGLGTIDYRLTDAIADPQGEADRLHSERLIRLDQGFLCYQQDADTPAVSPPPSFEQGYITFGSFNNMTKVTPRVIKTWATIMKEHAGSHLLLKAKQLGDERTRKRFEKLFAAEGISQERFDMFNRFPSQADHLGFYSRIDIALDPFPYNGTTTTCEALWMGVPVITLRGDRHAGRVGASILHRVGLDDLVASSDCEYVRLGLALAEDPGRLAELRADLRRRLQESVLMDSRRFTRRLEETYRRMWCTWCDAAPE
jgi:predicted O-linked N-acetylglucosamine transferase (SPINDLY family)